MKTIQRNTAKRRTVRPKAKQTLAQFNSMATRLNAASALLSAARGRR